MVIVVYATRSIVKIDMNPMKEKMMTKLMMVVVVLMMVAGCSTMRAEGVDYGNQLNTPVIKGSGDPIMYKGVEWDGMKDTAVIRHKNIVERVYND